MAYRERNKVSKALEFFDEANRQMQQSLDLPRQRNYRIEAMLLSSQADCETIYSKLLEDSSGITPETLFSTIGYNSFNTMYWLRWMLMQKNDRAKQYKTELIKHTDNFLLLDGNKHPQMSILLYFGKLAWNHNKKNSALKAWNQSALKGRNIRYSGVLQTLALRPLCELILNNQNPNDKTALAALEQDKDSLKTILRKIKEGDSINKDYFSIYFSILEEGVKDVDMQKLLKRLKEDIPYS